jgi:Zn-dependent metalloprotease
MRGKQVQSVCHLEHRSDKLIKMFKIKIISILLVTEILFLLSGCGGGKPIGSPPVNTRVTSSYNLGDSSVPSWASDAFNQTINTLNKGNRYSFILSKAEQDDLITSIHIQQQYKDINVMGAEVVSTISPQGELRIVTDNSVDIRENLSIIPNFSQEKTIDLIKRIHGGATPSSFTPTLLVAPATSIDDKAKPAQLALVWYAYVYANDSRPDYIERFYFIDANTGEVYFDGGGTYSVVGSQNP